MQMDVWQALTLVTFVIAILGWFNITPRVLAWFFVEKRGCIARYINALFAVVFSLYGIFVLSYIAIVLRVFDLRWGVLSGIVVWTLIGVWLPLFRQQRFWSRRFEWTIRLAASCLAALTLLGFWVVSWPDWMIPAVVTFIPIVLLIAYNRQRIPLSVRKSFHSALGLSASLQARLTKKDGGKSPTGSGES